MGTFHYFPALGLGAVLTLSHTWAIQAGPSGYWKLAYKTKSGTETVLIHQGTSMESWIADPDAPSGQPNFSYATNSTLHISGLPTIYEARLGESKYRDFLRNEGFTVSECDLEERAKLDQQIASFGNPLQPFTKERESYQNRERTLGHLRSANSNGPSLVWDNRFVSVLDDSAQPESIVESVAGWDIERRIPFGATEIVVSRSYKTAEPIVLKLQTMNYFESPPAISINSLPGQVRDGNRLIDDELHTIHADWLSEPSYRSTLRSENYSVRAIDRRDLEAYTAKQIGARFARDLREFDIESERGSSQSQKLPAYVQPKFLRGFIKFEGGEFIGGGVVEPGEDPSLSAMARQAYRQAYAEAKGLIGAITQAKLNSQTLETRKNASHQSVLSSEDHFRRLKAVFDRDLATIGTAKPIGDELAVRNRTASRSAGDTQAHPTYAQIVAPVNEFEGELSACLRGAEAMATMKSAMFGNPDTRFLEVSNHLPVKIEARNEELSAFVSRLLSGYPIQLKLEEIPRKRITVEIKDVTLKQCLQFLQQHFGLRSNLENGQLTISGAEPVAKN